MVLSGRVQQWHSLPVDDFHVQVNRDCTRNTFDMLSWTAVMNKDDKYVHGYGTLRWSVYVRRSVGWVCYSIGNRRGRSARKKGKCAIAKLHLRKCYSSNELFASRGSLVESLNMIPIG